MTIAPSPAADAVGARPGAGSRHRSDRVAGPSDRIGRLLRRGRAVVSLVPALVAVVLVQSLHPATQRTPTGLARFDLAGAWLAWPPGALAGYEHWVDSPVLGWLQLGALLRVLGAGGGQSVLAAAHGAMLLVTVAQVVLLWVVLRRGGAGGLAAGVSTAVFGLAPAAIVAHAAVSSTAVALVWLLAAAVLLTARSRTAVISGGVAAGIAVLTAPVAVLPLAGLVLHLARRPDRRGPLVLAGAALVAVIGIAAAVAAALAGATPTGTALNEVGGASAQAQWGLGAATASGWLTADPLSLLVVTAAVVLVAPTPAFRPLVAVVVAVALASFWPLGTDAVAAVLVLLALGAIAVAAVTDRAVVALGDPVFRRSLLGSGWITGVAAVLIVAAVSWLLSLTALARGTDQPVARADRWLRASVPAGQTVLVDLGVWPDLAASSRARVGWYAAGPGGVTSSLPWSTADYVLADDALVRATDGDSTRALAASLPVVGFGSGAQQLQVRAVRSTTPTPTPTATATRQPTRAERRAATARVATGEQLAENSRITMSAGDRAALKAGTVDSRVAIVLAQFVTGHSIVVASFPEAPDDDGIRRQVVISAVDGERIPENGDKTGELLRYLSSLRGQYAAQSIDATDAGVLAAFEADPTFIP